MSSGPDLTRWNRAGLKRFRYVDGNAVTFLELVRDALAMRFPNWQDVKLLSSVESDTERRLRLLEQYHAPRRDWAWEIVRVLARSSHVLGEHLDAYANEGFLGTATQWDNVRRLVEMIDYHPAPPASASTRLVIEAKEAGLLPKGFAVKHTPVNGSAPVVFETLEDIEVDPSLNALRPAEYNRNPQRLSGDILMLEGEIEDLRTGEPLVLEDVQSGLLRAYLISGTRIVAGNTQVHLTPRLSNRLCKGYTQVYAKPAESLPPRAPAAKGSELERVLRLTEEPQGLLPGMVIYIADGNKELYRRVLSVTGQRLVLDMDLGPLRLDTARVGYPVTITITDKPPVERMVGESDSVIYALRVAGDWSHLVNRRVVKKTVSSDNRKHLPFYTVTKASYHPADSDHLLRGYTILKVSWRKSDHQFPMVNPQTLLVPPAAAPPWRTDTYLEKQHGRVPDAIVTGKPKKTTAGDLAVVVMGRQTAWARLASVNVDLGREEATLTTDGGWQDRGGGNFFLSESRVHSHFKETLRILHWQENTLSLTGSRLPMTNVPEALEKGRLVMLERVDDPEAAFQTRVKKIDETGLVLACELPAGFTRGNTLVFGNLVLAGHGESKGEKVLGSGDATRSNQSFVFAETGVSFVADPTQPAGVRAAIDLSVAGRIWQQVGSLASSSPTDHHYTVRMTEAGHLRIAFGDGVRGRRLPSGVNNVRLTYRSGTGLAGNLPAGSSFKPAKSQRLVNKVRQPLTAAGGNDQEGIESLRDNAPATLMTLERAVSLEDFAWLAMAQSSIWQARAFSRPAGLGRNEKVEVVVVPAGGGELGTLGATLKDFLLAHALPEVDVTVLPYEPLSFALEVLVSVDAAAFNPDEVTAAVRSALQEAFSLRRRKLGQDLFLSEVYHVVKGVTGVEHSVAVINGNQSLRRLAAEEREVLTMGALVVTIENERDAAPWTGDTGEEISMVSKPRLVGRRRVAAIQGIGPRYAELLRAAGIRNINDLRSIDPAEMATRDLPKVWLWEFKTKAEVVVGLSLDRSRFTPLLARTARELVMSPADELARLTGESTNIMEDLQSKLRLLQIALNDEVFTSVTLRELVTELD